MRKQSDQPDQPAKSGRHRQHCRNRDADRADCLAAPRASGYPGNRRGYRGAPDRRHARRSHGARLGVSSSSTLSGSHSMSRAQPVLSESRRARRSAATNVHGARVPGYRRVHRHPDRHPGRSLSRADLRPDWRAVHLPAAYRVLRVPAPRWSMKLLRIPGQPSTTLNPVSADRSSARGSRSAASFHAEEQRHDVSPVGHGRAFELLVL